ncbi:hypothetical protein ACJ72_03976 [Emergomyces africanus]|uniref:Zinc finger PHD-type domain-containing protein n=1 Tax=Emergomyces africanus TaxID=1955775 RepID=A0A1B7NY30_9EURO|nr:hypothetical protein ACJ72_03976 [Emergomyces africanus]
MTPRRSSRARTSQPSTAMQHTNSSSSSNSLSRAERSTRSNNKISSPRRPSTQRSQSIDDLEQNPRPDLPLTRHRQRGRNNGDPEDALQAPGDEYDEEEGDEEEITRCLCGQQDYPGLPLIYQDAGSASATKQGMRDDSGQGASAPAAEDMQSEEPGSLFIQCDSCKVWQHGGCVGIMEEASSPDEYFCEECRKDLHKIITASNGQKSSRYLPVVGSSSISSSRSGSLDSSRNPKDKKSRGSSGPLSAAKRRSTMNSRDAAYDEEQLRRAIEESKEDSKSVADDLGSRRGKRSRSDSETNKPAAKRQRTGSPSSSLSKHSNSLSHPPSDDESKPNASVEGVVYKKTRGVVRNQREREAQTTEKEVEKEIIEPANRRKGRSDRRKDAVEEPSETTSPTKTSSIPPTISQSTPDTPNITNESSNTKPATRKTGRPPARRGRLGRNQYTRDRDSVNGNEISGGINSPRRGQSRDTGTGDSPTGGQLGANGVYLNGGESGKPSKPRYMNPQRTTMNEMKRRVAAILEFISQLQFDLASNAEQISGTTDGALAPGGKESGQIVNGDQTASSDAAEGIEANGTSQPKEKEFKDLTSIEMMDALTRNLVKWQQEFGKYGEK